MSLRRTYTLIAPCYDAALKAATRRARTESLQALAALPAGEVLLCGVGTGLDMPHLPARHRYLGVDLTPAMLRRAVRRSMRPDAPLDFAAVQGDAQRLPFADARFAAVVLHLILAVVPQPQACLAEAARVLRPGGTALIFDKFLRPGEPAGLRRALNPLSRRLATRLDVVFETVLAAVPALVLRKDQPALARGWFRIISLQKRQ